MCNWGKFGTTIATQIHDTDRLFLFQNSAGFHNLRQNVIVIINPILAVH